MVSPMNSLLRRRGAGGGLAGGREGNTMGKSKHPVFTMRIFDIRKRMNFSDSKGEKK
jgi:hypothetical protein